MIIFLSLNVSDGYAQLIDDEHQHCSKVLRRKVEDSIYLTDGEGILYEGVITEISKRETTIRDLKIIEKQDQPHTKAIAIAPTKNIDRFEWFLEKATEIGITDIYPFVSARSERKIIKPERLDKRILSAVKQSKNLHVPTLHPLMRLEDVLTRDWQGIHQYIAHCMEPESALGRLYTSGNDAVVLIGPEGDFTEQEVDLASQHHWIEVSLGASRLRTETAGLVACHLLNL